MERANGAEERMEGAGERATEVAAGEGMSLQATRTLEAGMLGARVEESNGPEAFGT